MSFNLEFPRATRSERPFGVIKHDPQDFVVEELLGFDLDGKGEHVWCWVEKTGQNTEYVGKEIARRARVRAMDVGYAGLKDRWAVTRQWFSIYLSNKAEPDWFELGIAGVRVLTAGRHNKKLRRGEHAGNRFSILVREVEATEAVEQNLALVQERGFPNYFGRQRFGIEGANLTRGEAYFAGKIKANRSQRAFYLSAARSYMFNLILAEAVSGGCWMAPGATGALYGDLSQEMAPFDETETAIFSRFPIFIAGLEKNRMKMARRPLCTVPDNFEWLWTEQGLRLDFELPKGAFATALLDEVLALENSSRFK